MIDLHAHSTASDGSLSPRELAVEAAARGLSAFALTDHDTVAGVPEAAAAARELGIAFVPGVEIDVTWEPGECHLLALGVDPAHPALAEGLERLAKSRRERNLGMLELMREGGVEADYGEIEALAGGDVVGRPHFAELLVRRRVAKNAEQAFSRYLGKGRPFYLPKAGIDLAEAIALAQGAGGVAVLAHPLSLYVSWGRIPKILAEWKELGLDGIEAWHPAAKVRACERLEALGRSLGYLVTAGSDFHGAARPERKLGATAGGRKIDDRYGEGIVPKAQTAS